MSNSDFGKLFKRSVGRPAKYSDKDELEKEIADYFSTCGWVNIEGTDEVKFKPPTISGMALYLGFATRQSMYEYKEKPEFTYIIKKATSLIESYHEESLAGKNPTGHIFVLKNLGWLDKTDVDLKTSVDTEQQRKDIMQILQEKKKKRG